MRIGFGTHFGPFSVFTSKNVSPGKAAGGCLMAILWLIFLPFVLIYYYVRWCIKNNGETDDRPVYLRTWFITTIVLVVVFALCAAFSPKKEQGAQAETAPVEAASQAPAATAVPRFQPVAGYDTVQSLFLELDGGATYADFIQDVKASGLEYKDMFVSGGQSVKVWLDSSDEYLNKLEVLFYNVGDENEYIRNADYWFADSAVRVNLHNDLESYEDGTKTLCIIDGRNQSGPTAKVEDFNTIKDAVDAIVQECAE